MIDIVLLVGRLLLVALLYLFLFAVMKTGIGLVRGQREKDRTWTVSVERGPKELRGVSIQVLGPVVVGRAPGADILIPGGYVSGRHARFQPMGKELIVEDLDSRNGTLVNGEEVTQPTAVREGDIVTVGDVEMRVSRA
ncbi:MAG: FHA domain-containing protein [Coriobacteriales bacterium]|nr:FHA domain-containing protein [Coriobacteriales bacterium]MBQ6585786.1 FHA domain-containing protein [Coriobacteriales bacterium]